MKLSPSQFAALFPRAKAEILPHLNHAMAVYGIESPVRMAAFLAQIGHESAGLTVVTENLNYSAQGLANTWPKRFAEDPNAKEKKPNRDALFLARKPAEIANHVYALRLGNGDVKSGDGWRYRGRGFIQITGRNNYMNASMALGRDFVADSGLLETPEFASLTAGWWWFAHGLNELADGAKFDAITKVINGGYNGLPDRTQRWKQATEVLNG